MTRKTIKYFNPRLILLIVILILVLFEAGFFTIKIKRKEIEKNEQKNIIYKKPNPQKNIPKVIMENQGKLSQIFPYNMPLYGQTEILESYTINYVSSKQTQGVYKFYSSKTIKEIFDFYKNWGEKNGWKILNTVLENNYQALFLGKENESLGVKMYKKDNKSLIVLEFIK